MPMVEEVFFPWNFEEDGNISKDSQKVLKAMTFKEHEIWLRRIFREKKRLKILKSLKMSFF